MDPAQSLGSLDASQLLTSSHLDISLKEDFGHHALILVAEQMAVEERNTSDDGIGEIHD
jgi:hypothetical protein